MEQEGFKTEGKGSQEGLQQGQLGAGSTAGGEGVSATSGIRDSRRSSSAQMANRYRPASIPQGQGEGQGQVEREAIEGRHSATTFAGNITVTGNRVGGAQEVNFIQSLQGSAAADGLGGVAGQGQRGFGRGTALAPPTRPPPKTPAPSGRGRGDLMVQAQDMQPGSRNQDTRFGQVQFKETQFEDADETDQEQEGMEIEQGLQPVKSEASSPARFGSFLRAMEESAFPTKDWEFHF